MNNEYKANEEIGWGAIAVLLICTVMAIVIMFSIIGVTI